jgi:hypothetical protein
MEESTKDLKDIFKAGIYMNHQCYHQTVESRINAIMDCDNIDDLEYTLSVHPHLQRTVIKRLERRISIIKKEKRKALDREAAKLGV